MKRFALIALALSSTACMNKTDLLTIHLVNRVHLEKNCRDVGGTRYLNGTRSVEGYSCEHVDSALLVRTEITCEGSDEKWLHEGWWFLTGTHSLQATVYDSSAGKTKEGYSADLYTVDVAGGLAPAAGNEGAAYSFEDGRLVERYTSTLHGNVTESQEISAIDVEQALLGDSSLLGCGGSGSRLF